MDKYQSSATSSIGRGGGTGGWGRRGRPVQKPHDFRGTMKMLWQALSGLESKRVGRPSKKHGVIPH